MFANFISSLCSEFCRGSKTKGKQTPTFRVSHSPTDGYYSSKIVNMPFCQIVSNYLHDVAAAAAISQRVFIHPANGHFSFQQHGCTRGFLKGIVFSKNKIKLIKVIVRRPVNRHQHSRHNSIVDVPGSKSLSVLSYG